MGEKRISLSYVYFLLLLYSKVHLAEWFTWPLAHMVRVLRPKCHPLDSLWDWLQRHLLVYVMIAFICSGYICCITTTPKLNNLKQKLIVLWVVSWAQLSGSTFRSLRVAGIVLESYKDSSGLDVQHGWELILSRWKAHTCPLHVPWTSHNIVAGVPKDQHGSFESIALALEIPEHYFTMFHWPSKSQREIQIQESRVTDYFLIEKCHACRGGNE